MAKIQLFMALIGGIGLAACDIPDFRAGERLGNPFARSARPSGSVLPPVVGAPLAAPTSGAAAAETACLAAGRDAGFDVQGVVGTREVIGASGLADSRDVMLRVNRSGQSVEVRCNYSYAGASARIMTL